MRRRRLPHLDERTIFLYDGLGGVITALVLGVVFPAVQSWIGMPTRILYLLAGFGVVYGSYSLSRYWFADHSDPRWLRILIVANAFYCVVSMAMLLTYRQELTTIGMEYFIAEIAVIAVLIGVEVQVLANLQARHTASRTPSPPPSPTPSPDRTNTP